MRACYRTILLLTGVVALMALAPAAMAADKASEASEKYFSPLAGGNTILADVAEVEPNNSLATAQLLNCGDVLRPASIGVARDTDYVAVSVTAGTIIQAGTDADGTVGQIGDTRIRLFNDSGVVLATDDDSGPGLYSLLSYTATYTGTYYVGFAAYSTTTTGIYKGFINCTVPQPPPANDQCAGAVVIECGNVDFSGTTQFATHDYTPSTTTTGGCTGYYAMGRDVAYRIDATGGDILDVNYTSAADASIYLVTDCADPVNTCVAGEDATLTGVAEHLVYTFTSSGTYYLILDNYGTGTGGAYTLIGSYTCPATAVSRTSWGTLKAIYR